MEKSENLNLSYEYYFERDGTREEFSKLLNCFQAPLYFYLKATYKLRDPFELFTQDPTFMLMLNDDQTIKSIEPHSRWSSRDIFDLQVVRGKGEATFREIEQLLDRGKMVFFQTHSYRIPFHRFFISKDTAYNEAEHRNPNNHVFVLLDHDEHNVYYMDGVWMINEEHFVSYNNTRDIGVFPKAELMSAFECYLDYFSFEPKPDAIQQKMSPEGVLEQLKVIQSHAYKPAEEKEGVRYEYNIHALESLIELCEEERIDFAAKSGLYQLDNCGLMEWKFETVRQRKLVILKCMERMPQLAEPENSECIQAWADNTTEWQNIVNRLRRMIGSKRYGKNAQFKPVLEKLLQSEKKAARLLEKALSALTCAVLFKLAADKEVDMMSLFAM